MTTLQVRDLPLAGLKLVQRARAADARGFLARLFDAQALEAAGWRAPVAQVNHTLTTAAGTVRGLHLQLPPHAEMKLVSCVRGEVWDVAVDLRARSATFGQWHAERLSADNGRALLIPQGFAHGFQSLQDDVELVYCHSAAYAADAEWGVDAQDPRLAIAWPLPVIARSPRDSALARIATDFEGVRL